MHTACHALHMVDVVHASTMIYNFYKSEIEKFKVEFYYQIGVPPYHTVDVDTLEKAWYELDQDLNAELDNIGVYYNEGKTIFIRVYKNAKVDVYAAENYKNKGIPINGI
ncbi:MAG: hypothetical protein JWP44_5017 [Mucilaginibacter sp.]|nr:hypothetical protein [Mucilaginibacter sp.]